MRVQIRQNQRIEILPIACIGSREAVKTVREANVEGTEGLQTVMTHVLPPHEKSVQFTYDAQYGP